MPTTDEKIDALRECVRDIADWLIGKEVRGPKTGYAIKDRLNALTKPDDQPATAEKPAKCEHGPGTKRRIVDVVYCKCGCGDVYVMHDAGPGTALVSTCLNERQLADQNDVAVQVLRELWDWLVERSFPPKGPIRRWIDAKIAELTAGTQAPCKHEALDSHIVACVNAFHEAGIEPADLKLFVEAVRAWDGWDGNDTKAQRAEREKTMDKAAALLPENRKETTTHAQ